MPRGRNRRSAAAAAANAVARPLALALALVSTLPRAAHSKDLVLPRRLAPAPRTTTCDNVPEPFSSRRNEALPGFVVICGPNREAMLSIGGNEYRIDFVSVPGSYVVIFAEPITQVCYDDKGEPTPDTGTGTKTLDGTFTWSLEGTPFTFSKSNKLVNFGCNRKLMANFSNLPDDPISVYSTSCVTTCNTPNISSSCRRDACCQAPMDQVNGAKVFALSFERTTKNGTGEEDGTCSAAFFLDEDDAVFFFSSEEVRPLKKALLPQGERRMILYWAIGSNTCDQAQTYTLEPLCKYGTCVDAPSGAGYVCKCPDGYDGNPYVSDGCKVTAFEEAEVVEQVSGEERSSVGSGPDGGVYESESVVVSEQVTAFEEAEVVEQVSGEERSSVGSGPDGGVLESESVVVSEQGAVHEQVCFEPCCMTVVVEESDDE